MPLIEIKDPTPSALRWFGPPVALLAALLGALAWSRAGSPTIARAIWAAAAALLALYYALPSLRRPLYLGWMYATYPLGFVLSHLAMAVVYYLVLTPIGLLLRARGRDLLELELDRGADSYWRSRRERGEPGAYFRQY